MPFQVHGEFDYISILIILSCFCSSAPLCFMLILNNSNVRKFFIHDDEDEIKRNINQNHV